MSNLHALAASCGIALAACTTPAPPPVAPAPTIAASQPSDTSSKTQPSEAAKPPQKPAQETAPKKPAPEAKPAPKAMPAPAPAATGKSVTPKAPPKPFTSAPPKTEAAAAAPKPETAAKAAPATAPAAAPAAKPAPLDLKSLEQRLKDSNAIGVMTKLSLKNQVDDLVDRFRAYHSGERPPTLPQLRPAFELLLMKVLSLLQDKDPALAHDIDASREAIWGVLSDRARFAQFT